MLSSSDSKLFICYSVLPADTQDAPLPSVVGWAVFSLFVSAAVGGHTSALYRRVDRTIASYNLIFTLRLIHLFFHNLRHFSKHCCCFHDANCDVLFATAIMRYVAIKLAEIINFLNV